MLIPIRKIILLLFIPVSSFDRCNAVAVSEQNRVQKPANHPKKRSSTAKPPASKRKKASSSTNFVEPSGSSQKVSEQTSDCVTGTNQMQGEETTTEPISNSSIGAEHQDLTKDLSAKPVEKEKKSILQRLRDRFSRKKE